MIREKLKLKCYQKRKEVNLFETDGWNSILGFV